MDLTTKKKVSHKVFSYIMMIIVYIIISNSNMACEMCELCEIFPKFRGSIELELTEELTEPNTISHNSQEPPIILNDLLHLDRN